eukprot:1139807-Pelagomonas_calceolata.AAC.2
MHASVWAKCMCCAFCAFCVTAHFQNAPFICMPVYTFPPWRHAAWELSICAESETFQKVICVFLREDGALSSLFKSRNCSASMLTSLSS